LWEEQKSDKLLSTEVHGIGHLVRVSRAVKTMQQVRAVAHRLKFYGHNNKI